MKEIEEEFPRPRYPRVHASLQAIHRAQVLSLRQQARPAAGTGSDGALDELVSRLARFTAGVLRPADRFGAPEWEVIAGLIRGSCPLLLLQAVADQPHLTSPALARRLERHFPVPFGALPRLRRRARRRWRRTERVLGRRGIDASHLGL